MLRTHPIGRSPSIATYCRSAESAAKCSGNTCRDRAARASRSARSFVWTRQTGSGSAPFGTRFSGCTMNASVAWSRYPSAL